MLSLCSGGRGKAACTPRDSFVVDAVGVMSWTTLTSFTSGSGGDGVRGCWLYVGDAWLCWWSSIFAWKDVSMCYFYQPTK